MKFALVTACNENPLQIEKYKQVLNTYKTTIKHIEPTEDWLESEEVCYIELESLEELIKLEQEFTQSLIIEQDRYTKTRWDSEIKELTIRIWDDCLD